MKRREFLNTSLVAGAAAFVAPAAAVAQTTGNHEAAPTSAPTELGPAPVAASRSLSRAWFEQRLGKRFQIETEGGQVVDAELIELKDARQQAGLQQFSAVFRTQGGVGVSGLRLVSHAGERFQLLLGEPHDIGDVQLCQAHFGLLV